MQVQIKPILYRNKQVDEGIILGVRPYRWTLKRQYSPCYAKNGQFISELSPQKRNFLIYIPKSEIKIGEEITVFKKDYLKSERTWLIKFTKVINNFAFYEILNTEN